MKKYCMKLRSYSRNGCIFWLLFGLLLISQPSFGQQTKEIKKTNITGAAFTISWITDTLGTSAIQYGTDTNSLNLLATDDRLVDTHYITANGLSGDTTYYYDIVSAGVTDDNYGQHYSIKTGPSIFRMGDDFVHGYVYKPDGTTTVPGSLVYLKICNLDGKGSLGTSSEWSTIVNNDGMWIINLINVRTSDLSNFFEYSPFGDQLCIEVQAGSLGTGKLITDTANDSLCQDIMVTTETTPPCTVINLSVGTTGINSVILSWSSPGDDGDIGTAAGYEIRYSTTSITESNWSQASIASGIIPSPAPVNTTQQAIIENLVPWTKYYFAIKAYDEAKNWSLISNIVATFTLASQSKKIKQTNITGAAFTISWITDTLGTAAIQYGTDTNSLNLLATDDRLTYTHHIAIEWLSPNTTYYYDIISDGSTDNNQGKHYSLKTAPSITRTGSDFVHGKVYKNGTVASGSLVYLQICDADGIGSMGTSSEWSTIVDENGLWGIDLINVRTTDLSHFFEYSTSSDRLSIFVQSGIDGTGKLITDTANDSPCQDIMITTDPTPPGTITNLSVGTTGITSVSLQWSSSGDDGYDGIAAGYEIRYSTTSITENNWSQASIASGVIPSPKSAGTTQQAIVTNLVIGTGYCFAIKAYDEAKNWSGMSNIVAASTYGTPTSLTIFSGDRQKATVTTTLTPFIVKLTDASDDPVGYYSVIWQIIEPGNGAALSATSTATNINGITSTIFTLGTKTGTYTVIAAAFGLIATFTATAIPDAATNTCVVSGNGQQGMVKTTLTKPFMVKVTDIYGNPILGHLVGWQIIESPAEANLSATTTTTGIDGIASSSLTLGTKSGTYRVRTIDSILAQATFTATAVPGQIKQLAFISPTAGTLTVGMPGTITLRTQDEYGNISLANSTTIVVSGNSQSRFASLSSGATWTETGTFSLVDGTSNRTFFFKQNGTATLVSIVASIQGTSSSTIHTITIEGLGSSSSGVVVADDGKTTVKIDTGAITGTGGYIEINTPGTFTVEIAAANEKDKADTKINRINGTLRKFEIHGATIATTTATAMVRISIPYPDADNDGFVDGIRENSLRVYMAVGTGEAAIWEPIKDSWVDPENNMVCANVVTHFSYYILMGPEFPPTLEKAIAYPNPYNAAKHAAIRIKFDKLTENSTIKIFNIAGELVREIRVNSPQESWDACNSEDEKVASGIYLYLITDPAGNKKVGKLGVIR
ncbi:MAG: fibronectin type III domain-containing protein [Candidatus Desantisbacteria bacterium]